jgi:hypothetical protein
MSYFILEEGDRHFVAEVLIAYSRRMLVLVDEAQHGTADAGASLQKAAHRAEGLARQVNPVIRKDGFFIGLEYPKKEKT